MKELDKKALDQDKEFDINARVKWKSNEEKGIGSTLSEMQQHGRVTMDQSFVGKRIELYSKFDISDDGKVTDTRWCGGVVEAVSDGTWRKTRRGKACWKIGEVAKVMWDPVPEVGITTNYPTIEEFKPNKWNQDCDGAWRMDLGEVDYGL